MTTHHTGTDTGPTRPHRLSLEEAVKRIVDAAPPLTADQQDLLRVLLCGVGSAGTGSSS